MFLTRRGKELLDRARKGHEQGKVEYALLRDIEKLLLDSYESANDEIEQELKQRGA